MAAQRKTVKLKNLASATAASVQAALGKQLTKSLPGGITTGIVLSNETISSLATTPAALAKQIAQGVRAQSGISVTPQVAKIPSGILMGYQVPRISKG